MIVLYSTKTGKPFSLSEDGKTLRAEKAVKSATCFPDSKELNLKEWAGNACELRHVQSTAMQETMLQLCGRMKYSEIRKV